MVIMEDRPRWVDQNVTSCSHSVAVERIKGVKSSTSESMAVIAFVVGVKDVRTASLMAVSGSTSTAFYW